MSQRMLPVFIFFFLSAFLWPVLPTVAEEVKVIEVIGRQDCAHCREEEAFLRDLADRRGDIEIVTYDAYSPEGKVLFDKVVETEGLSRSTPITAVGGVVLQGFGSPETTGRHIVELLDSPVSDAMGFREILDRGGVRAERSESGACEDGTVCRAPGSDPTYVSVPFLGVVDISTYSLPVLSAVLGFVDGFNPCAMWVLVTFLLVLVQFGDRRKVLLVAGLFVLAETVMYYLILNVWLTAWDFIGLDRIVTPFVGIVAIGGGIFFLYEWYRSDGTCLVTDAHKRAGIASRIRSLASQPFTWVTAAGVVALALSVNVIEFACSIGIPQTFTKILEMNEVGFLGTQGFMFIYILSYMLDDLVVFGLALWGAKRLQTMHGYAKWCNLFGGALMIVLGLLLVFRPEKLLF
ncbi:MAG: glutaredoxin [Candidatus Moranbacteria bacterium]|nr:glutaredoxin [Candidatus Moranbacteria bacterium]